MQSSKFTAILLHKVWF